MQPFIGQISIMSFNFAPRDWATCDGQLLSIAQNQALFSILGTTYGGDGTTNFALPDLRGRQPIHFSNSQPRGQRAGEETHTLLAPELPQHTHTVKASTLGADTGSPIDMYIAPTSTGAFGIPGDAHTAMAPQEVSVAGSNEPHDNMAPYTVLNFVIALLGVFPPKN
jgi:microcystin-dependent protein